MCRSARLIRDHEQGVVLEARLGSTPERSVRALFNLGERPMELPDEDAQMGQRLLFSSEAEAYRGGRTRLRSHRRAVAPRVCRLRSFIVADIYVIVRGGCQARKAFPGIRQLYD